jgi:hypothetical protein
MVFTKSEEALRHFGIIPVATDFRGITSYAKT